MFLSYFFTLLIISIEICKYILYILCLCTHYKIKYTEKKQILYHTITQPLYYLLLLTYLHGGCL